MKTCWSITDLNVRDVGQPLIERLAQIYPAGFDGHNFRSELPEEDPRVGEILLQLTRAGLRQEATGQWGKYKPGKEFSRFLIAKYDESDFSAARFFSWLPHNLLPRFNEENSDTTPAVARLLSLCQPLDDILFASTNFAHVIVTVAGRMVLDEGGFTNLEYVPAFFVDDRDDVDELRRLADTGLVPPLGEAVAWELRPTIVLPPMLPKVHKHLVAGVERQSRNPTPGDRRMAYSKDVLNHARTFDIALPNQADAEGSMHKDALITSARFFQVMRRQKGFDLKDWLPVREE